MRAAATGELAHHWPEAQGLLPPGFGREVDRYCVLELERDLEPGAEPPDAPAELADAVSAIRLATAAPVAAGPGAVRAAGLAAVRDPAGAADRGDAAAGRGDPSRLLPGRAHPRAALAPLRSPTGTRRSPRRSIAGSSRSSRTSRSGPSSCAAHSRACSETRGSSARLSCSATPARSAARFTPPCGHSPRASRRRSAPRMPSGVRSSRRCGTATRPALVRSLDDVLLGLRSAPRLAHTA